MFKITEKTFMNIQLSNIICHRCGKIHFRFQHYLIGNKFHTAKVLITKSHICISILTSPYC